MIRMMVLLSTIVTITKRTTKNVPLGTFSKSTIIFEYVSKIKQNGLRII
jgi:hypothetical protein